MTVDDIHAARFKEPPEGAPYRWAIIRLQQRIAASGLSTSEFSRTTLIRAPNTTYRWLRAEYPIPKEVRDWLLGSVRLIDDITTTDKEVADG